MRAYVKIMICKDNERFMGIGPERLLRLTEESGSLRQAAMIMGMSYSKAHALIKHLEKALKRPVLKCQIGGSSGGGASLTEFGHHLLKEYEMLRQKVEREADSAFVEFLKNLDISETGSEKE